MKKWKASEAEKIASIFSKHGVDCDFSNTPKYPCIVIGQAVNIKIENYKPIVINQPSTS